MGLIPPFFFDCVVAIGIKLGEGGFQGTATGFLYGHFLREIEKNKKEYGIFLVTSRHVLEDRKVIYLRFNPENINDAARDYPLDLEKDGKPVWLAHANPKIDIAVVPINFAALKDQNIRAEYFRDDMHVADIQKMNDLGIMEGDGIYVLGFPLGIVGEKRNIVIARSGSIARIRDTLLKRSEEFLIDASIFPGNSGGAVVSRPEATRIANTKAQDASYLIGIVCSYVPYIDEAISTQTGMMRVKFQENSGLAKVHQMDFVKEIIEASFPTK